MRKHLFFNLGSALAAWLLFSSMLHGMGNSADDEKSWLRGFQRPVHGEHLSYHSPHKERDLSLIHI